jgi:DNA-directed RNA polymerase specialized sigma24 family protein
MQAGKSKFPTTDWGLFADIRSGNSASKIAALDILVRRYWKPVLLFLRHSGRDEESAKDLTQAFFAHWIENDVFARADERQGRFRSFMLTCLKRFAMNECRANQAGKRMPTGGLVSLDELMECPVAPCPASNTLSPDAVFNKVWATEVLGRVLRNLEAECRRTGKTEHFDIFSRRIICPILDGAPEIPLADLAARHGLTEKQTANHLLTAKRAYRRLLEEEIRLYAETEAEVADEVRALFRIVGGN